MQGYESFGLVGPRCPFSWEAKFGLVGFDLNLLIYFTLVGALSRFVKGENWRRRRKCYQSDIVVSNKGTRERELWGVKNTSRKRDRKERERKITLIGNTGLVTRKERNLPLIGKRRTLSIFITNYTIYFLFLIIFSCLKFV